MYAIYIKDTNKQEHQGWFKSVYQHKGTAHQNPFNGEERFGITFAKSDDTIKKWRTLKGAKEYADKLSRTYLATTKRGEMWGSGFDRCSMKYNIMVVDIETNQRVYELYSYSQREW